MNFWMNILYRLTFRGGYKAPRGMCKNILLFNYVEILSRGVLYSNKANEDK